MTDDLDAPRSFWTGTAAGGPIDGSEIAVEAAPRIPMRAMHVILNIGDDVATADWHLYVFGQKASREKGVEGVFTHIGPIPDYPPAAILPK